MAWRAVRLSQLQQLSNALYCMIFLQILMNVGMKTRIFCMDFPATPI
ncbi:hypothetical protein UYSO10_3490 [Kosakonia radicincitans]|nr:hypothetical protein UYSO10_3490 [Kosakonia radicincitans]